MNKEFFKSQIDKLTIEYSDKGFTMNKEKAAQWYGFMKDIPESTFEACINFYLLNQRYPPTMADIMSAKEKVYSPYKED